MGDDLERKLREARDELDYQETLRRQGEAQSQRMATNHYVDDDWLGYDDGRPGMSWSPHGGLHFGNLGGLPVEILPRIIFPLVLGLIGFGLWAWNSCNGAAPAGTAQPAGQPPAASTAQQP